MGELHLTASSKEKLLRISAATVDRLLQPERRKQQLRGRSQTKPGTLLKHQIPIRTFAEWDEQQPGFVEMDLVAHDGGLASLSSSHIPGGGEYVLFLKCLNRDSTQGERMKRLCYWLTASLTLIVLYPGPYVAQGPEALRLDWLAKDYKSVELLVLLGSPGPLTVQGIRDILSVKDDGEERDIGFGASTFEIVRRHGYTTLYVEGFAFNGSIGFYKVGMRSSNEIWPRIRERVIHLWNNNRGPGFNETETGIVHIETNDAVLLAYKSSVSVELGEMKQAEVPDELKKSFDYLTSPIEHREFGGREGESAIDALVNANRVDLIENVLRGFSVSGRVYAALALLKLNKKNQMVLSPDVVSTLAKVRNLNISIRTVRGCEVSYQTAAQILSEQDH